MYETLLASIATIALATSESVLFAFPANSHPYAALAAAPDGSFYGTTQNGGIGYGTVFHAIPPSGRRKAWTQVVINNFTQVDGLGPNAGVVADGRGNLFGLTSNGGPGGAGAAYELTPPSKGQYYWTETVLHFFSTKHHDGTGPAGGPLVLDDAGRLYGVTHAGGACVNCGTIFSLTPPAKPGGAWSENVIHEFGVNGDGYEPYGGLIRSRSGALYGTTTGGGPNGNGMVFQLTPPSRARSTWTETVLHWFGPTGSGDGFFAEAALVQDASGRLFGTTQAGGSAGVGTAFSLTPPPRGDATWTERVLHSFTGTPDGAYIWSPLTLGPSGSLYAAAAGGGLANAGTVFVLMPPPPGQMSWSEATVYDFQNGADGANPFGGIIRDEAGALFGATAGGGVFMGGTLFRISP